MTVESLAAKVRSMGLKREAQIIGAMYEVT